MLSLHLYTELSYYCFNVGISFITFLWNAVVRISSVQCYSFVDIDRKKYQIGFMPYIPYLVSL